MERFFLTMHTHDPLLQGIKHVDYYTRDLLDTKETVSRISSTIRLAPKHPVRQAIFAESTQGITDESASAQIRKFAHAEQKALDRLALLLPEIITKIYNQYNARSIHSVRIHMLVNNDSCGRCDAVIKAAIEPNGWLTRTLRAKIGEVRAYVDGMMLDLADGIQVSAAVSSFEPYNTGEVLTVNGGGVPFYSRGGVCKHVHKQEIDQWSRDGATAKVAVLKYYKQ